MSDAQFRLLIQRSFDEELTKQEHRSLVNHLETSESGQKFHHQLEQMIQASQDSPLPDELHPQNPEALAKRIIEQMPQKKASFLSMFTSLFGGGGGGSKNGGGKSAPSRPMGKGAGNNKAAAGKAPAGRPPAGRGQKPAKQQDQQFAEEDLAPSARPPKGSMFRKQAPVPDQEETETQAANFSRLKSIGARGDAHQDSREAQSTTRSLGEKFGMPGANLAGADEGPLTLAESIRRKVSESQKLSPVEEADMSGSFEEPNHDVFARTQPAMEPPQNNAAMSSGFSNSPNAADWMSPGQSPNTQSKSSIGLAPPGGPVARKANNDNPFDGDNGGQQAQQAPSAWGTAPAGTADATPPSGQVGWGHAANQEATPAQAAPSSAPDNSWGSGWNNPEAEGRAPLKSSDSWAMPDQAANQDGSGSTGWGDAAANTAPNPYNNADPAPQASPQPVSDPGGWGGWSNNSQESSPAAQPQPAAESTGQQQAAWGHQANQSGQAQAQDSGAAGGWGSADSWSAPTYQAEGQSTPAPSSDPWAQASAIGAADSGMTPPAPDPAPSPNPVSGGWGNHSTPASNAGERPSWSMEAEQMETGTWTAFKPGSGALNAQANAGFGAPAAPQAQQAPQAQPNTNDRWDLPIQERNKAADAPAEMGHPAQPATAPAGDNRWDVPIQERGGSAPAPQPASNNQIPVNQIVDKMGEVLGGQTSQSASTTGDTRWDVPIQERNKQAATETPSAPISAGWGNPATPAAPVSGGWGDAPAAPAAPVSGGWGDAPAAQAAPVSGGWGDAPAAPVAPVSGGWGDAPAAPVAPVSGGWGDAPAAPVAPVSGGWGDAPAAAPINQPAPQVAPTNPIGGGMFNLDDSAMDKIFNDNLGVSEPTAAPMQSQSAPMQSAPQPAAPAFRDIPVPNQTFEASPPPAPPMPAVAAPIAAPQTKGLFNLSDSDLDRVFEQNLGIPDESVSAANNTNASTGANTGWSQAPQPIPVAPAAAAANPGWGVPAPAPAAAATNAGGGAPTGWSSPAAPNGGWAQPPQPAPDANAGWSQPPAPVAPPAPEPTQNYGQSQFDPGAPAPKIEGIGRLDASADTSNDSGSGRIAAIGKFLLDQKDYDKIGKLTSSDNAEGKLRVLTNEASQDLQALLGQIGGQQGVIGSVIVGHDGLIIANTMPGNMDAESMGVWALGVFMNTQHVVTKMGHERVHQVVSRTPRGFVVIADFGGGLLVTVTDGQSTDQLIPLMRTITQLVN